MLDGMQSRPARPRRQAPGPESLSAQHRVSRIGTFTALLAMSEAAAVVGAAALAKLVYLTAILGESQSIGLYLAPAILLAAILHLFLKQADLYDPDVLGDTVVGYGQLCGALAMSLLVLLGVLYFFKVTEIYSRGWILIWFATSAVGLIAVRVVAKKIFRRMVAARRLRRRVALFGTMEFLTAMKAQIESATPANVVMGQYLAQPTAVRASPWPIDGGMSELKAALARGAYDKIVIGLPSSDPVRIRAAVSDLASYSTELLLCTELEPDPVVVHESRNFGPLRTNVVNLVPLSDRNGLLKTLLDYTLAGAGLLILSPLFAAVAIAIKIDSPGPVFFRQRRYGRNNRIFRIFKFRTMAVTEDGRDVRQAQKHDVRVTRVGRFLRRTSIDELPQLLNVLTGDMSLVGPRPHALVHDDQFEQQLDQFSRRRRVRPGLTGWAQVHGFRGETRTEGDIRGRMQHDLYYIDNWSIWLDIEIMTRTVFVVLFRGAY